MDMFFSLNEQLPVYISYVVNNHYLLMVSKYWKIILRLCHIKGLTHYSLKSFVHLKFLETH